MRTRASTPRAARPGRAVNGIPARRLFLRNGHLPRISGAERHLEVGKRSLEEMGMTTSVWKDRPVLITGATGLVGSWLTRRLIEAQADVVCLIRDWIPQSEIVRSGLTEQLKI